MSGSCTHECTAELQTYSDRMNAHLFFGCKQPIGWAHGCRHHRRLHHPGFLRQAVPLESVLLLHRDDTFSFTFSFIHPNETTATRLRDVCVDFQVPTASPTSVYGWNRSAYGVVWCLLSRTSRQRSATPRVSELCRASGVWPADVPVWNVVLERNKEIDTVALDRQTVFFAPELIEWRQLLPVDIVGYQRIRGVTWCRRRWNVLDLRKRVVSR